MSMIIITILLLVVGGAFAEDTNFTECTSMFLRIDDVDVNRLIDKTIEGIIFEDIGACSKKNVYRIKIDMLGIDLKFTLRELYEISEKRKIAKTASFALNYGGNGTTVAQNVGIPDLLLLANSLLLHSQLELVGRGIVFLTFQIKL